MRWPIASGIGTVWSTRTGRIGGMTSEPHQRPTARPAAALDAPDIGLLARFYEQLAGWRRVPDDGEDDMDHDRLRRRLADRPATGHRPRAAPLADQDHPQQAHLDFRVPDIDAAAERAQQLGASLLRRNERWHTLADPAGARSTCAPARTIRGPP